MTHIRRFWAVLLPVLVLTAGVLVFHAPLAAEETPQPCEMSCFLFSCKCCDCGNRPNGSVLCVRADGNGVASCTDEFCSRTPCSA